MYRLDFTTENTKQEIKTLTNKLKRRGLKLIEIKETQQYKKLNEKLKKAKQKDKENPHGIPLKTNTYYKAPEGIKVANYKNPQLTDILPQPKYSTIPFNKEINDKAIMWATYLNKYAPNYPNLKCILYILSFYKYERTIQDAIELQKAKPTWDCEGLLHYPTLAKTGTKKIPDLFYKRAKLLKPILANLIWELNETTIQYTPDTKEAMAL